MAVLDDQNRQRLFDYILGSLGDENAADLEAFARNFLHNAKVWDLLADHFPDASASGVRGVMMEAFAAFQKSK